MPKSIATHTESATSRTALPGTLGELRAHPLYGETRLKDRSVKDEMRENLIARLRTHRNSEPIFPGIVGYEDTVVPQIVNAVLSRQNFILLGLRGQAKSRILRALTALLDEQTPYVAGCEIRDNPTSRSAKRCRDLIVEAWATHTPIAWLTPRRALRRKARDPGRHRSRPHRRSRPDQSRARRPRPRPAN